MKFKKTHYRVHALQDGTIWLVIPTRKPRKGKMQGEPEIDQDGIHYWYLDKPEDEEHNRYTDWGKGVWHTCVATALNVKRIVRQQVEVRLESQQQEIAAIREQLTRIEDKLDRLLGATGRP